MKNKILLLLALCALWQNSFSQSQYATINLGEFEVTPESYLEDGEIEPNLLLLFESLSETTDFRLDFLDGFNNSVHFSLELSFSGNTYEMEINGGAIFDETTTQISQSPIQTSDNITFGIVDSTLYYIHNQNVIATKAIMPTGIATLSLTNLVAVDADIYLSVSSLPLGTSGNLMGMVQRTTSPFCVIPSNLIPTEARYLCGPIEPPVGLGIEDININLGVQDILVFVKSLNDAAPYHTTVRSDPTGIFSAQVNPGMIEIIPFKNEDDLPYYSYADSVACDPDPPVHISAFDSYLVSTHYIDSTLIDCPLRRIAGDVNQDGVLNLDDSNDIQDFILGNIDSIGPDRWRFVPKAYVIPNATHPDYTFISNFWNSKKSDNRGQEYPFNSSFSFNGTTYTYKGEHSWMDEVHEWPFGLNEACGDTNWGFYLIEAGNVAQLRDIADPVYSSLVASNDPLFFVDDPNNLPAYQQKVSKNEINTTAKNNQKLTIRIVATSSIPIVCYQLGMVLNPELSGIDKIKPQEGKFKQTLESNFGHLKKNLDAGIIRTVWISDPKTEPNGLVLNDDILFEVELKAKKTEDLNSEELLQLLRLDHLILPSIFFGKESIDHKAQLVIEVLDKGELLQSYSVGN